jgi:hypothetical protein
MIEEAAGLLIKNQNADGGWGAVAGKQSNTEATALSLLALQSLAGGSNAPAVKKAEHWLAERQNGEGSWPFSAGANAPSWSTALAMIALSATTEHQDRVIKAGNWVLKQEGSKPGLLVNLIRALSFRRRVVHLNEDLIGWSWTPNSFSWVEPTGYFLLALKKIKSRLSEKTVHERIEQGELMIYDRMCGGGGWNYGNASVYGDGLWPYPDITAIALLALQDRRQRQENQLSLRVLGELARNTDSGLALGWSAICMSVYEQAGSDFKKRLEERYAKTGFLGETKPVALAILAMGNGANYFRV